MASGIVVRSSVETLERLAEKACQYAADSRSPGTRKSYEREFDRFATWCDEMGRQSLPASPATLALYLTHLADEGLRAVSIGRILVTIGYAHRMRGYAWNPSHTAIHDVMEGIRRKTRLRTSQKAPADDRILDAMIRSLDGDDLLHIRNRAMLSIGWFGAFRRSEIVALNVDDLTFADEGLIVRVNKSKTDQHGVGAEKGIRRAFNSRVCAVRNVREWLDVSRIDSGPLFRWLGTGSVVTERRLNDKAVARLVKQAAERVGFNPRDFGGHSLRSGFTTTAARKGKSLDAIMRQTLHKSERVVLAYIRHATVFDDNASDGLV